MEEETSAFHCFTLLVAGGVRKRRKNKRMLGRRREIQLLIPSTSPSSHFLVSPALWGAL